MNYKTGFILAVCLTIFSCKSRQEHNFEGLYVLSGGKSDFTLLPGQSSDLQYTLKNVSASDIKIVAFWGDCHCTNLSIGDTSLEAGKSTSLFVHFRTDSSDRGPQFKRIFIQTEGNDKTDTVLIKYKLAILKN